jgi:hypothetical protein
LNVENLFSSTQASSKKKNDTMTNITRATNVKPIETLKENIYSIDIKLIPIEEEFRHKTIPKKIVSTFEFNAFGVNLLNGLMFGLILIFLFLNVYKLTQKDFFSFRWNNYNSPIESILPDEIEKTLI